MRQTYLKRTVKQYDSKSYLHNLNHIYDVELENIIISNCVDITELLEIYLQFNASVHKRNEQAFLSLINTHNLTEKDYLLFRELKFNSKEEVLFTSEKVYNYMLAHKTCTDTGILLQMDKIRSKTVDEYIFISFLQLPIETEIDLENTFVSTIINPSKRINAEEHDFTTVKLFQLNQIYNKSDTFTLKYNLCNYQSTNVCNKTKFSVYTKKCKICNNHIGKQQMQQGMISDESDVEFIEIDEDEIYNIISQCLVKKEFDDITHIIRHSYNIISDKNTFKILNLIINLNLENNLKKVFNTLISKVEDEKLTNMLKEYECSKKYNYTNILNIISGRLVENKLLSFILLHEIFIEHKSEEYKIKGIVIKYKHIFIKELKEIVEWYITTNNIKPKEEYGFRDIEEYFTTLVEMFSDPDFINTHIDVLYWYFTELVGVDKVDRSTCIKYRAYYEANQILKGENIKISTVETLTYLLGIGVFDRNILNRYFKPNVNQYIIDNTDKIMYYIKRNGVKVCIYEVLFFIIRSFNSSICKQIVNYLQPTLEYFIVNNICKCREMFLTFINKDYTHKSYICLREKLGLEIKYDRCNSNTIYEYDDNDRVLEYIMNNIDQFGKSSEFHDETMVKIFGNMRGTKLKQTKSTRIPSESETIELVLNTFHNLNDYNKLETYYYAIQEYLKNSDTNNPLLIKYKNTKYKYKGDVSEEYGKYTFINNTFTSNDMLRMLFIIIFDNMPAKYSSCKHLVLLDDIILVEILKMLIIRLMKNDSDIKLHDGTMISLLDLLLNTNLFMELSGVFSDILPVVLKDKLPIDKYLELAIKEKNYYEIIRGVEMYSRMHINKHGTVTHITELEWYNRNNHYKYDVSLSLLNLKQYEMVRLLEYSYSLFNIYTRNRTENIKNAEVLKELKQLPEIYNKILTYNSSDIPDKDVYDHIKYDVELIKQNKIDTVKQRIIKAYNSDKIIIKHVEINTENNEFKQWVNKQYIKILKRNKEYDKLNKFITSLMLSKQNYAIYESAKIKYENNRRDETVKELKAAMSVCDEEIKSKALIKYSKIINSKKQYEIAIGKIDDKYLMELYYLYARVLERTDPLLSIYYYYCSFSYNYESIPKFIFLINKHIPNNFTYKYKENVDIKYLLEHNKSINSALSHILHHICNTDILDMFISYFQHLCTNLNPFVKEIITKLIVKYNGLLFKSVLYNIDIIDPNIKIYHHNMMKYIQLFKQISKKQPTTNKISINEFNVPDIKNINIPGNIDNVYIEEILSDIYVFNSLQKPKKIGIRGNNGKIYEFILKNNDDLRRDSRFMDLNRLLNKMSGTNIVIYDVIPFSENNGIMEYIGGLESLKGIVQKYYTEEYIRGFISKYVKKKKLDSRGFMKAITTCKPVFGEYFISKYTDGAEWYNAIQKYTRSYAEMCVVGWFMGLGDRHTENILFAKDGSVVHVDLNMIFNGGKRLSIPERVPFRLTSNIIDGFGYFKLKLFKKVFGDVLKNIYSRRENVISNLLSFVYDPIISSYNKKISASRGEIDIFLRDKHDDHATKILEELMEKLKGNVEERVNELIEEATSVENLKEMYVGWMSYL